MQRLDSFPQNNQGLPNILEVQGDAPPWIKDIIARLQFKKAVTRWLNILVSQFEDNVNVKLFEPVLLQVEELTLYEQPNFRTNISATVMTNLTAADATVTIYIITDGTTPATVAWHGRVPAGGVASAPELSGQAVESNEKIVATASVDNAVSIRMSGLKDRLR